MNSVLRAPRFPILATVLMLFTLHSGIVLAVPSGPVVGKVMLVLGTVTGSDQDGDAFEVKRGVEIHGGFSFETGSRSFVRAEMNDGTRLTLSQNGSVTIDDYSFDPVSVTGSFNTTVTKGGFRYVSGLLGQMPKSHIHSRISTPNGVIGVRGTIIEAVLDSTGRLIISVPQGGISVTYTKPDGSTGVQVIGVDEDIQIIEVTPEGVIIGFDQLPPVLQTVVTTLVEMVNVAEQQSGSEASSTQVEDDETSDEDAEDPDPGSSFQFDTEKNTLTPTVPVIVEPNPSKSGSPI